MRETTQTEHSHVTLLDGAMYPDNPDPIRGRYIWIGDKIFYVTEETCYHHLLSNGSDYYPYYDNTLRSPTRREFNHYIDNLLVRLRSDLQ